MKKNKYEITRATGEGPGTDLPREEVVATVLGHCAARKELARWKKKGAYCIRKVDAQYQF